MEPSVYLINLVECNCMPKTCKNMANQNNCKNKFNQTNNILKIAINVEVPILK